MKLIYESEKSLIYHQHVADTSSSEGIFSEHRSIIWKVLNTPYPTSEQLIEFYNEYECTKNFDMDMEGTRKVLGLSYLNGKPALQMPYIEGMTLKEVLSSRSLSLQQSLEIAVGLARILSNLHAQKIIHKDITAQNIIVSHIPEHIPAHNDHGRIEHGTNGVIAPLRVHLIDFGLASMLSFKTSFALNPEGLEGTLAYLSPEQTGRVNRVVDFRSDLYSLGVTLYELFTGTLPFSGLTMVELVHAHIAKQPESPYLRNSNCPPIISDIILKLLAKDPQDRYQSATGLCHDLEYCSQELTRSKAFQIFPLAQYDVSDRFDLGTTLYGREKEIAILLETFGNVTEQNTSEILFLTGDAGVGKTALVQEVQQAMALRNGLFVSGKFDLLQRNIPYYAWLQALEQFTEILLTESEEQLHIWKERISQALGSMGQVLTNALPALEMIIGPQPDIPVLSGVEAQNRFELVMKNFAEAIARPEHPLIFFIDDLQWADTASLDLLRIILTEAKDCSMLVLGAYREKEVSDVHPLHNLRQQLQQDRGELKSLHITALQFGTVRAMVKAVLHTNNPDAEQALAEFLIEKTQGNPFFLNQLFYALVEQKLIQFHVQYRSWEFDIRRVQEHAGAMFSDNVLTFMEQRIVAFSSGTQEIIKLAACIGNRFDLHTLASLTMYSPLQIAQMLNSILAERFIVPMDANFRVSALLSHQNLIASADAEKIQTQDSQSLEEQKPDYTLEYNAQYIFAHDRIQQAAYSLILADELALLHYTIGKRFLRNTTEQQQESLFDIVHHLWLGIQHCQDSEREEWATLYLEAGKKAKASVAYATALTYFQRGLSLIDSQESWHTCYHLMLALSSEMVEAHYLLTEAENVESAATRILPKIHIASDKVRIYETLIRSRVAQAQFHEAIMLALDYLEELGEHFPRKAHQGHIVYALAQTKIALYGKDLQRLVEENAMTDSKYLAVMLIIKRLLYPAYQSLPNLFPLLVFRQVVLSVKYGFAPSSAYSFICYAIISCGSLNDIAGGSKIAAVAIQMLRRFDDDTNARSEWVSNNLVQHWTTPLRQLLPEFIQSFQKCMEVGDHEFAALSPPSYFGSLYTLGFPLHQIEQSIDTYRKPMLKLEQLHSNDYINLYMQVIHNLRGQAKDPCCLHGEAFDDETVLAQYYTTNYRGLIFIVLYNRLQLANFFGDIPKALADADAATTYLDGVVSNNSLPTFCFHDSLARLRHVASSDVPARERRTQLARIRANQKKLKKWGKFMPENNLHFYYLIEAELWQLKRKPFQAREYYDKAIDAANAHGFLHIEALAYECAGIFYLHEQNLRVAQEYLQRAHTLYHLWGATGKTAQMESAYPRMSFRQRKDVSSQARTLISSFQIQEQRLGDDTKPLPAFNTDTDTFTTASTAESDVSTLLDLESLWKASQTISKEVVLEQLLASMMNIVVENAGAERGYFLMPHKDTLWRIAIDSQKNHTDVLIEKDEIKERGMTGSIAHDVLPASILNYVLRTKKNVLLGNASGKSMFVTDPYIIEHQPKSILCLPIIHQSALTGMMYLENNAVHGAFTEKRMQALLFLSSQIGISLENALLYRNLEQKVMERTSELRAVNETLQEKNFALHELNNEKNELMGIVSHDLKNPIGAIRGFADLIQQGMATGEVAQDFARQITVTSERMLDLVKNLLDLNRFEQGGVQLQMIHIDIAILVESILWQYQTSAEAKDITLNFTPDGLGYEAFADEQTIIQVLDNIISNAIKYSPFHKNVFIRVLRNDAAVRIEIQDEGEGISSEDMKKLFGKFARLSAQPTGGEHSTGLGLSIVKKMVEAMNGKVWCESEINNGATFIVELLSV